MAKISREVWNLYVYMFQQKGRVLSVSSDSDKYIVRVLYASRALDLVCERDLILRPTIKKG